MTTIEARNIFVYLNSAASATSETLIRSSDFISEEQVLEIEKITSRLYEIRHEVIRFKRESIAELSAQIIDGEI